MQQQPIDIRTLSVTELKALAYDLIAQRDSFQNNLNTVNTEISLRAQKEQEKGQDNHIPRELEKV
jgi:hypothetical protein